MSSEIMVTFCFVNMALCFSLFAVIYFRYAKHTKSLRAKPHFENLEEKFNNYKGRLKQLDQERKLELTSKNSGTSNLGLDKIPKKLT